MIVYVVFVWSVFAEMGGKRSEPPVEVLGGGPHAGVGIGRILGKNPRAAMDKARLLGAGGLIFTNTPPMIGETGAKIIENLTGYATDRRAKKTTVITDLAAHLNALEADLIDQPTIGAQTPEPVAEELGTETAPKKRGRKAKSVS